jgi:hypothetical protein
MKAFEKKIVLTAIVLFLVPAFMLIFPNIYRLLKFCMLHRLMATFTVRRKNNTRRKYGNLIIENISRY